MTWRAAILQTRPAGTTEAGKARASEDAFCARDLGEGEQRVEEREGAGAGPALTRGLGGRTEAPCPPVLPVGPRPPGPPGGQEAGTSGPNGEPVGRGHGRPDWRAAHGDGFQLPPGVPSSLLCPRWYPGRGVKVPCEQPVRSCSALRLCVRGALLPPRLSGKTPTRAWPWLLVVHVPRPGEPERTGRANRPRGSHEATRHAVVGGSLRNLLLKSLLRYMLTNLGVNLKTVKNKIKGHVAN